MTIVQKTELLCPAGTIKAMDYAFAYGADAVYAGQPRFSLRVRNNSFNKLENLAFAINKARELGKKLYVVVNIAAHNDKLKSFITELRPVIAMQPHALIMSDPGMIMLVREHFPDMDIHLSVQANAVNWATVKFWHGLGLKRIILSRELSISEIAEIRQRVPEIELEVFVHGALCMAYSGRCLLSGYINHRDANQGTCTNACRWAYQVTPAEENILGEFVSSHDRGGAAGAENQVGGFLLRDRARPDEEMPIFEDEHGTYIMNSKDLRAVQYVEKLIEIGVDSLKIEGRTKSHYYVARTAQIYRQAIDDALAGRPFNGQLMEQLESLANRGYTEGFLQRHKHKEYQNYDRGSSHFGKQIFVGEVAPERHNGLAKIIVKNRFACGDDLEIMTLKGNYRFRLKELYDENGHEIAIAKGDGHIVYTKFPKEYYLSHALLMRDIVAKNEVK